MIEALKKKSGLIPYYSTKEPVFIWISDSFYASGPLIIAEKCFGFDQEISFDFQKGLRQLSLFKNTIRKEPKHWFKGIALADQPLRLISKKRLIASLSLSSYWKSKRNQGLPCDSARNGLDPTTRDGLVARPGFTYQGFSWKSQLKLHWASPSEKNIARPRRRSLMKPGPFFLKKKKSYVLRPQSYVRRIYPESYVRSPQGQRKVQVIYP